MWGRDKSAYVPRIDNPGHIQSRILKRSGYKRIVFKLAVDRAQNRGEASFGPRTELYTALHVATAGCGIL
jgi:hypothetical protein